MARSTDVLVRTKVGIPPTDSRTIERARLLARVAEGVDGPLTLVSAPAGFGKSTLLGEWARRAPLPVAWVSLDGGDSDPGRLAAYLGLALERIDPSLGLSVGDLLGGTQSIQFEMLLACLINEVTAFDEPLALVLDDCHVIEEPAIFEALAVFIDRLPPNLHLILAGREDPPLPLARYRARRWLTEIRVQDLRFTPGECATFLGGSMGLSLDPADVATLEDRTEGWAAGLQLAALSLQGHAQAHGFVQAFSGVNRHIVDYLVDEVLSRQSLEVRDFLYRTSILERLSAPLCDAVTASTSGRDMLRELEARNLFLLPLDDERSWYRYHGLFASALRLRSAEAADVDVAELHRRAGGWFEQNGMIDEAVHHAIAAGDGEGVAALIERMWIDLVNASRAQTLWDWTGAIDADVLAAHPRLLAARAWAAFLTQRFKELVALLSMIDDVLATSGDLAGAVERETTGHAMAIRSFLTRAEGDLSAAAGLAERALQMDPDMAPELRGVLAFTLGWSHFDLGDLDLAQHYLEQATQADEHGNYYVALFGWGLLGRLHQMRGELAVAEGALRLALEAGSRWGRGGPLPLTVFALAGLGDVAYERNELAEADRWYERASELRANSGDHSVASRVAEGPLKVALARGEMARARQLLEELRAEQVEHHGAQGRAFVAADAVAVALAAGDVAEARTWAPYLPVSEGGNAVTYAAVRTAHWRLAIATGEAVATLSAIGAAVEHVRAATMAGVQVGFLGLLALARESAGEHDGALDALEEAVSLAERLGFVRSLLDLGDPIPKLLADLQAQRRCATYCERLLARIAATGGQGSARLGIGILVDPLSAREAEVLSVMAEGAGYQGVADTLFVSVNTVRHHVKSIYRKLDVNSQGEAVARARKLGML